ncbi:uncharacterized protein KZ484_003728 isoform 2-T2 [Pholidichthys leucotaenia]
MANRLSFHSQLSSIMETMARSALNQVCKLVDEDSAELRLELSRLLFANSALTEKVNSLECELTIVKKSDAPNLSKSYRSVGVQTPREEDAAAPVDPVIDVGFGGDWYMNLWKDRGPYSLEGCSASPLSIDKSVAALSDQITVTEINDEHCGGDAGSSSQQETVEENEEIMSEEPEQLSVSYSFDGSACSVSFDQDGEHLVSADGSEDTSLRLIQIDGTETTFSTHIIPIEEDDDDDDDVQFIQESQPSEPAVHGEDGPSHGEQQTLPLDNTISVTLDKDSQSDFNMLTIDPVSDTNTQKFTCKICNRTFFHKGTLTHHMKSHKANFCNICKQHFPHRYKLNSHNCLPALPSQQISKSCELCGKTFANPSALRIHYLVHTGEKPHRCNLCGKRFTQKGNLKCHLRIHTGERPFRCIKCGKTFTQKVNLNHHLMAHINREVVSDMPADRRILKGDE